MNERGEGTIVIATKDEHRLQPDQLDSGERGRWELLASRESPRLVRLCARLTGSVEVAEDLAQETLVEAWRQREKLQDWSGDSRWLSQVARYVCLRWCRHRGRDVGRLGIDYDSIPADAQDLEELVADEVDVAIELERNELSELLDRAMEFVSPGVRELLTRHYIEGLAQSELAALLGTTEGAVAVRLHRGKLVLRRVLLTELQDEAAAYGLVKLGTGSWQETDAWCTMCGASRLHARWSFDPAPGWLTLRCPLCYREDGVTFHDAPLVHALSPEIARSGSSYRSLVREIGRWVHGFYRPTLDSGRVPCPDCGRPAVLHLQMPDELPAQLRERRGLHFTCAFCDRTTTQGFEGLVTALPEVQAFAGEHPRFRTLPERQIEAKGRPAIVTAFESVPDGHRLDVVSARDSYRILGVHGGPARSRRKSS